MKDTAKTKEQLIAELEELRQQWAIEQAAENTREEVLAMRSSDDLAKVVAVLLKVIRSLGVETPNASILFINEEADQVSDYTAWLKNLINPVILPAIPGEGCSISGIVPSDSFTQRRA